MADSITVDGQEERLASHARRRESGFDAGVAGADDDHLISLGMDEHEGVLPGDSAVLIARHTEGFNLETAIRSLLGSGSLARRMKQAWSWIEPPLASSLLRGRPSLPIGVQPGCGGRKGTPSRHQTHCLSIDRR